LRDQGIDLSKEKVERVREQGAIPFYRTNKLADVGGVASYSGVAKSLEKTGHRVLHKSVAQPYFPIVVNKNLRAAQMQSIQRAVVGLGETEDGRAVLRSIGVQNVETSTEKRLRDLLAGRAAEAPKRHTAEKLSGFWWGFPGFSIVWKISQWQDLNPSCELVHVLCRRIFQKPDAPSHARRGA
jgi:hypothetical protein